MKIGKKIVNLVLALAISVPMAMSTGALNLAFADGISAKFTNSKNGDPVNNLTIAFYEKDVMAGTSKKIFTVATKNDGKLNKETLKAFNGYDISNVVDSDGNINLKAGTYYYVDEVPASGFYKKVRPKVFTVLEGGSGNPIDEQYTPISELGQAIVEAKNESGEPLEGMTYDLYALSGSNYIRISTFSTDKDGLLTEAFERTSELPGTKVDVNDGTMLLSGGKYKLTGKNSVGGYSLPKEGVFFSINSSQIKDLNVRFVKDSSTPGGNDSRNKTGASIKVLDKNTKKGVPNQEIAVYSTDVNGKNETLIFVGKTNAEGKLDTTKVSKGAEFLLNDGTLILNPGNYYYKLHNYANAKKHIFKVESGKINNQVLYISLGSSGKTSNNNISKNTKRGGLAKTGFANTLGYSVAGLAMISSGVFTLRKKNN